MIIGHSKHERGLTSHMGKKENINEKNSATPSHRSSTPQERNLIMVGDHPLGRRGGKEYGKSTSFNDHYLNTGPQRKRRGRRPKRGCQTSLVTKIFTKRS